jgi:hypothetical protein
LGNQIYRGDNMTMKNIVCEGDFLNYAISSWIELFGWFPSANADKANTIASILSVI